MQTNVKTCSIMQPTFLPWSGYFNLIKNSDFFVFLSDSDFQKNSWHNRNQILMNGKINWLTCPVSKSSLGTPLYEMTLIPDNGWKRKNNLTLEQNYKKTDHFEDIKFIIFFFQNNSFTKLVDLNVYLIKAISEKLGLKTKFYDSREFKITSNRSEKLLEIISNLNCDRYLSPQGAKDYINKDDILPKSHISIEYQNFIPAPYKQLRSKDFISHLSILDVISNIGLNKAKKYIE